MGDKSKEKPTQSISVRHCSVVWHKFSKSTRGMSTTLQKIFPHFVFYLTHLFRTSPVGLVELGWDLLTVKAIHLVFNCTAHNGLLLCITVCCICLGSFVLIVPFSVSWYVVFLPQILSLLCICFFVLFCFALFFIMYYDPCIVSVALNTMPEDYSWKLASG